jgi:hypothetical protein
MCIRVWAWIAEWGSNGQTVSHARFEQMAPIQKGEMSPGTTGHASKPISVLGRPDAPNCEVWNVWTCLTYVWSYSNRFSNHQNMFLTFFYMLMYRMWLLLGNPTLALPTGRVLSSTARRPSPKTSHAWDVSKEIRTKAGFILYCIPKPQSIQTCCWDLLRTCPSLSVKTHTFCCFIFVGSI